MEDNNHLLLQPLIIASTTTSTASPPQLDEHGEDNQLNNLNHISSSNSSITIRVLLLALIGVISIWASHFTIGYSVAIENESLDTSLWQRFHTFYVSNDEATRIIVKASENVRDFLYPEDTSHHHQAMKRVNRIVLRLKSQNSVDETVAVGSGPADHSFVISISPSLMEGADFKQRVLGAVQRGVARVWLYDGRGNAPENVTRGLVGYIAGHVIGSAALSSDLVESETLCWRRDDVASSLNSYEKRRPGFIRRLNQAMMDGWDEGVLDRFLGEPVKNLGATGNGSSGYNYSCV